MPSDIVESLNIRSDILSGLAADEIVMLRRQSIEQEESIERLVAVIKKHEEKLEKQGKDIAMHMEAAASSAHVIILHGVVPGSNGTCRCGKCRVVALQMEEAGYLAGTQEKWWKE